MGSGGTINAKQAAAYKINWHVIPTKREFLDSSIALV